jgi:hypothetical protein
MAKGGARLGAGRPRNDDRARWLGGDAGRRSETHAPRPLPPIQPVDAPTDLTPEEVAIWERWAPLAQAERTLTPGTVGDFAALCRLEVEMAAVLLERRTEGWTKRGLSLAKEYRGLVTRVENKRRAFRLAPMGKPLEPAEAPKDEWAEFDGGSVQ